MEGPLGGMEGPLGGKEGPLGGRGRRVDHGGEKEGELAPWRESESDDPWPGTDL